MARATELLFTLEDFLAFDDGTDTRYELHDGRLVAMGPASLSHGELVMRLGPVLGRHLQPPCRVISEAGVAIPGRAASYYQADLVVTCEARRAGQLWVEEPVVLVEVLSPSTAVTDYQRKLPHYRRIAPLRHILLIDSERVQVQHLRRDRTRWVIKDAGPGDRVRLGAIAATIDVDTLYQDIPLEEPLQTDQPHDRHRARPRRCTQGEDGEGQGGQRPPIRDQDARKGPPDRPYRDRQG